MHEANTVGERVREVRKRRGLSQRELAERAGLSASLVKKLEQGAYGDVRLETLHKLATVLRVPTTALAAGSDAAPPEQNDVDEWAPVRRALEGLAGEPAEQPTMGGLRESFDDVVRLLVADHYAGVRVLLPALLRDADALVAASVNGAELEARRLRSQVRQLTAYVMSQTWQFDVTAHAVEMALDDAGDGFTAMAAVDEQCWGLIRAGRLAESREIATQWADDAEPRVSRASRRELAAWGKFLLRLSAAAARDNRPGEARDAIRLAKVAAVAVGNDAPISYHPWEVFGPARVAAIQAENAMVQDRPEITLSISQHLDPHSFPVSRHYHRNRLDVARAHVALREYCEAVEIVQEVRAAAPEWLEKQHYARDILAAVIAHRRTLTPEMRELADFLGLPL